MRIKLLGLSGSTSINLIAASTQRLNIEELKAVLATTGLEKAELKRLLMLRGLNKAEAEQAANTIIATRTMQEATVANNIFTATSNSVKTALNGLGAVIKAHPIMTIITAVSLAITVFEQFKQKAEETAREATQNAVDGANNLKNSLEDIDSYIGKIDELKEALSKDDISQSEATEKRKQLLAIQEELIKKYGQEKDAVDYITESIQGETTALNNLQIASAKDYLRNNRDKIKDAYDYFNNSESRTVAMNDYHNTASIESSYADFMKILTGFLNTNQYNKGNGETYFSGTKDEIVAQYDDLRDKIQKYIDEHPINPNDNSREADWERKTQGYLNDYLDNLSRARNEIINDENYDANKQIYDTAVESLVMTSNKYSEYYGKIVEKKKAYTEALTSGNQEEITKTYTELQDLLNEIFSLDFIDEDNVAGESIKGWFEKVRSQIYNLSKETPIIVGIQAELKDSPNGYVNKIKTLSSSKGYTASDLKSIIAKGDLGEDLGDDKDLYDNIKGYVDLWNGIAQNTGQAIITADEYIEALEKVGVIQKEVAEGSKSSFALSKDQTKELKSVHSDVDKLNKAYQNLFAGKLTTNDVVELVDLFPTLGEYVDWTDEKFGNLAEGIDKVIRERPANLIEQLEKIDKSGMSDEAKKAIDSMIAALKQLKPELIDTKTLIEEIQKAIKGVSSSISTLIGFTKEISENGSLSLSSIDTIMTDDTYKSLRPYINDMESMKTAITELTNKQKDAYEDLYNAEMYEKDYEAYHKAVQQKEQENENLLNDSVKQIEDEIKYFNDAYGIDITNWDNLSETKKTILQNTNAELLSKQASLINTFKSYYDTDLTNYKNTTAAKAAILENFRKSEAFAQATKIAIENDALGNDYGEIFLADKDGNIKNKINSILSSSGLTWEDYVQYLKSGTFTSKGNEALQKSLDEIVKPYSITPIDWEKMTANIKSTGSSSSSSSSPSGSSSSSSSSSSSKNYIDWIERRLKKFAQTTKEVFAKVADYISFNNQNSQLRKAINAIRDEIAANEQSYQYYMDEANKVGLDPYWQWFVQNGARNISDIQDEALREKISRYKELYDNAINCKDAVEELKKTEKEYATQMLSNVEKYYSNRITYTNSNVEYYNSLDTDNLFVSKNYDAIRKSYNEQISYTQKQHDNLLSTLNSLVSSGSIKYQSDEWYEWWDKIQKCNVEVRNLKKNIHDLASEELQNIQEYWDNRIGAYDNTISYINTVGGDSTRKGSKDYKGLKNAYNSQIKYTSKQVLELQARLDKAVKAGDIEKYSDEWYKWTGIIEQGKEKVVELQTSIHQLAVDELQDIQNRWDNRINNANSTAEYFNSVDTDNLYINKNFGEIRKSYKKQIADTKKEKQKLIKELNSSDIEKYSNEWYEWQKKIDDCDVSVRNLQKSVRNLANEELQGIQNRWNNRIGVYDSTISYINTVGGDSTRKGSKDYKGLENAYNSQIKHTSKQVLELQARLNKAVKAGDIEKYSDKWYEWVSVIEQGKEKVAELQANIHKLVVEQFEEIQKNYDNQLNLFEHTAKEYENKNKEIETRGLLANSKYYFKLQENEKNNISILKNQAKDLEDSLNQAVKSGNIEVGSEEWYKMRDAILSVNEQIDESNIKLLEYEKTIREIGWEVFSFLQDRISQLTTESDFLIDLMSNSKLFDDSGNITAKGRATMGLHTQNYNVYMAQAEQYAAEISRVNAQLAQDPHNTDIIKHREELLELQQKSILSAEKEKKAIIDLTKEGFDAQLKSLKKLIETYTKSLDAAKSLYDYQKNINDKTSNITKLQKQLNAYQGDSSEETQARIQQLQTKLKEAQEDLQQTEYEKLISDTKSLLDDLYDNYEETLNNRLDNVDALVGDMIGVVNNNSNDINNTIKSSATEVGAILSKEITDIWSGKGAVNGNIVSGYYNGFDTKLTSVQTTLNNISNNVSTLAQTGEKDNQSTTSTTTKPTTTNNKPSTPQGTKNTTSATKVSTPSGTTNSSNSKKTTNNANKTTNTKKSSSNTNKHNTNSSKQRTDKENYGVALAIINGNYGWGSGDVRKKNLTAKGFNYDTVQGIVNKLWKDGYVHTGAWKGKYYGISDLSPYAYKKFKSGGLVDYTGIAQVDGTPMKPESFLNADDTQNIADLRDTLRELAARPITMANGMGALGMFGGTVTPNILDLSQKLQALSGSDMVQNLNVHNENHIEIDIDKVEDYNDFITKMQKDRKFENIIQDMTFGRMNGGSSLAKYRH